MNSGPIRPVWLEKVPEEEWSVYEPVLKEAQSAGVRFALGGAFALATYTDHLRNTKDLDIYVLPSQRELMVSVVGKCGLEDMYSRLPYDRGWIYRACCESRIVDIIWAMPNRRSTVDLDWLTRGPEIEARGYALRILPIEELFWAKLYVMQRERCDWPDILNLLYYSGGRINWEQLLARVGDDFPLLTAVLTVFSWLCPERAEQLPSWLWNRLGMKSKPADCGSRSHLLDTRPWFGADFPRWPD